MFVLLLGVFEVKRERREESNPLLKPRLAHKREEESKGRAQGATRAHWQPNRFNLKSSPNNNLSRTCKKYKPTKAETSKCWRPQKEKPNERINQGKEDRVSKNVSEQKP